MHTGEKPLAMILEVVQRGYGTSLGEVAEQELSRSPRRDSSRHDAAGPSCGRSDRGELLGEKLVGLEFGHAACCQPLRAEWKDSRVPREHRCGLELAPLCLIPLSPLVIFRQPGRDPGV